MTERLSEDLPPYEGSPTASPAANLMLHLKKIFCLINIIRTDIRTAFTCVRLKATRANTACETLALFSSFRTC